jgi:hypothetical protein
MKTGIRLALAIAAALTGMVMLSHCGGGSDSKDSCPGLTCNNCSGSGNCNLSCPTGKVQVCRAHPDNSSLRCTYCQSP